MLRLHRLDVCSWLLIALCACFPAVRLAAADPPPAAKKLLRVTLKGQVHESDPPLQLFASALGVNLREVTSTLRDAAKDDKVGAVLLRLKSPLMGWTQLQTIRRELLEFRKSGKPAYCHLDAAGSKAYILASAASEVSMMPTGIIEIPGLSMQLLYMKGLLDKLGIRFEELRMGRYKSAAESLTRDGPSDPVKEEIHSLLDHMFEDYVDSIARNRSLEPTVVRGLVDRALFNAKEAKAAGLVDRIEYEDEFMARVRGEGDDALQLTNARIGKSLEIDLSGFGGLMKLMNDLLGGPRRKSSSRNAKLALIYGLGTILPESAGPSLFGGGIMGADEMVKLFRTVREDDTVKAVVFRIDSPGGSALASDQIWREVKITAAAKPVVVSMGDMAASGGYYIACPATWIVAERSTLTGSIGVIGAVPNLRGLYDLVGLSVHSVARGKRAQIASPYGELTDDGREMLMKYMREVYDDFVGHVAKGRKLPVEAVAAIAEGRVWTGGQALKHGLVDELGGVDTALAKARSLAGLPGDVEMLVLPKPRQLIDLLMGSSGDSTLRAALRSLPPEAKRLLQPMEWVRALRKERVFAVFPDVFQISW